MTNLPLTPDRFGRRDSRWPVEHRRGTNCGGGSSVADGRHRRAPLAMLPTRSAKPPRKLSTIHARDSRMVFQRIASYALTSPARLPVEASGMLTVGALDFVVHLTKTRLPDGRLHRYISSVISSVREVLSFDGSQVISAEVWPARRVSCWPGRPRRSANAGPPSSPRPATTPGRPASRWHPDDDVPGAARCAARRRRRRRRRTAAAHRRAARQPRPGTGPAVGAVAVAGADRRDHGRSADPGLDPLDRRRGRARVARRRPASNGAPTATPPAPASASAAPAPTASLPAGWPWAAEIAATHARLRALPAPA